MHRVKMDNTLDALHLGILDILVQCTIDTVNELPVILEGNNSNYQHMTVHYLKHLPKEAHELKKKLKDTNTSDNFFSGEKFHFLSTFFCSVSKNYAYGATPQSNPVIADWLHRVNTKIKDSLDDLDTLDAAMRLRLDDLGAQKRELDVLESELRQNLEKIRNLTDNCLSELKSNK